MPAQSSILTQNGRQIALGVVLATAYVFFATLGFRFAFAAEQVTTVWAPTGIAVSGLLLWGRGLWPAVWLGALAANLTTDAPMWTAFGVATGNALEAVGAAWGLQRVAGFDPALRRVRDVLAFVVIAALLSTAISATLGVTTLCAGGVQPWTRFALLWRDWWLGDALGALVAAPAILTTVRMPSLWSRRQGLEGALLVIGTLLTTQAVFGQPFSATIGPHPLEYVIFLFVIAAAMRLGQPAAAYAVLGASAVTIWNTVRGAGPFTGAEVHQNLILLQIFMAVLAGTALVLAAAMTERKTGERRRAAAHAVSKALTEGTNLDEVVPAVLGGICRHLRWQVGSLWTVEAEDGQLRPIHVWSDGSPPSATFAAVTLRQRFASGIGLPGRVLASKKSVWIEDVIHDSNFPRALAARAADIHGGFAFPITLGDEVLGVIECFNKTVVMPDADLLQTMSAVGGQIGQFIGRKRIETAMRDAQIRTRAIVDTALDAIIGMNHRGFITDFNPAAERMFGYRARDVIGRELADLLIPAELRHQQRTGLATYMETGVGSFIDRRVETNACHADGHSFPVEVAITRVASAEPPQFTGFVRDLTARVAAEQEREQLLARELSARRDAEAANRAKDDFLATLSHELRTPLNAIVGWTRMLLDSSLDPPTSQRAIEVIDRNASILSQLVGDILDVSQIITGGLRLNVVPVDLGSVIAVAFDSVRPAATAKGVQLRSQLTASARLTGGDPQRLQQIVWNLVANAVKFTPPGGSVMVELFDNGSKGVQISVRDDGIGIDSAFLPYVFERFRRAEGPINRQQGGLGLGLAIVRNLVELHGGTVRAESAGPGKGATFTVDLPRQHVPEYR